MFIRWLGELIQLSGRVDDYTYHLYLACWRVRERKLWLEGLPGSCKPYRVDYLRDQA